MKKPNKTVVILLLALAAGGLTLFLAKSYISKEVQSKLQTSPSKTVKVLVANQPLSKGAPVNNTTVVIRDVPAEWVQSQTVLVDQFERVESMKLAFPMQAGDMLMWSSVEDPNNATFSTRVASGRRALTVPVDEINSISGMLQPGDVIDIYILTQAPGSRNIVPVLRGVKVMAAGQRISVSASADGRGGSYSAITLDVNVKEAELVTLARQAGSLVAMLRNPQDAERGEGAPDLLAFLTGKKAIVQSPGQQSIPILYVDRPLPSALQPYTDRGASKQELASLDRFSSALERLNQIAGSPNPGQSSPDHESASSLTAPKQPTYPAAVPGATTKP